ncbi:hypothetical protein PIB30_084835 [Stylosanthes scabra]|uniref:Uncharacterized protein n=1 Tax=Stylosanthes scabra TaxID=79078 RepID=A0ABU6RSI7_9FABA|nr:hypothetical protein [Stylosanthes scabra]
MVSSCLQNAQRCVTWEQRSLSRSHQLAHGNGEMATSLLALAKWRQLYPTRPWRRRHGDQLLHVAIRPWRWRDGCRCSRGHLTLGSSEIESESISLVGTAKWRCAFEEIMQVMRILGIKEFYVRI